MPGLADAAADVARRFGVRAAIGHSLGAAAAGRSAPAVGSI